jgi:pyruvate/2-oxoglutarate/acetoin dehydrogenase E1 component
MRQFNRLILIGLLMSETRVTFAQAIEYATRDSLLADAHLHVIGLGVDYKNGADGTMGNLKSEFPSRILDTPISESTTTGLALGSSLSGQPVIIHHGRVEFALFAADQIFNQAAKWNYMFGGGQKAPLTIRIAIGRQWGNGPQHSASYLPLFASTPGLRVVFPSTPSTAYDLLKLATTSDNYTPTVIFESRWLYGIAQEKLKQETTSLERSRIVIDGEDVTIITFGDGVVESLVVANHLRQQNLSVKIVDLLSLSPIDYEGLSTAISGSKRIIIFDPHQSLFGVGSEICRFIVQNYRKKLVEEPILLTPPFRHVPTAPPETADYYVNSNDIIQAISKATNQKLEPKQLTFDDYTFPPKVNLGTNWSTEKY